MDTQSSDRDHRDSSAESAGGSPPPAAPPVDDGRFAVPWALPDEDDNEDR